MAKKAKKKQSPQAGLNVPNELPPGVKLLRVLEGHGDAVRSLAFDPEGNTLASGSSDQTVRLWDVRSGKLLHTLEGQHEIVRSLAFAFRN